MLKGNWHGQELKTNLPGAIWILQPVSACNLDICSPPFPITKKGYGMVLRIILPCSSNFLITF